MKNKTKQPPTKKPQNKTISPNKKYKKQKTKIDKN